MLPNCATCPLGIDAGALSRLSKAGAKIIDLPLTELSGVATLNRRGGFAASEAYAWHHNLIEAKGAQYDPRVLVRIMRGKDLDATHYIELIRARADLILAFGAATWPHQLVRIMLAEQIYRAVTILAGHPYHRA